MVTNNTVSKFLRLGSVLARVGLSRSQVYKMIGSGQFPSQVKLSSRSVAWIEEEISEWMSGKLPSKISRIN